MTNDCRRFQPLAALAPSGQLSPQQGAELREHCDGCTVCAQHLAAMQQLSMELFVAQGLGAFSRPGPAGMKTRFLRRALAEGVPLAAGTRRARVGAAPAWAALFVVLVAAALLLPCSTLSPSREVPDSRARPQVSTVRETFTAPAALRRSPVQGRRAIRRASVRSGPLLIYQPAIVPQPRFRFALGSLSREPFSSASAMPVSYRLASSTGEAATASEDFARRLMQCVAPQPAPIATARAANGSAPCYDSIGIHRGPPYAFAGALASGFLLQPQRPVFRLSVVTPE